MPPTECFLFCDRAVCSVFPGCAAQRNFCDGTWCQNGGTCVSRWNMYLCECPLRFGGKNCEQGEGLGAHLTPGASETPILGVRAHVGLHVQSRSL